MAKLIINLNGVAVHEVPLDQPRVTLGRAAGNDIRLDDATVSGKHAIFEVVGDAVFVEDLGSTNGTVLSGQKVQRHRLHHGDVLRVGQHDVKFVDEAEQDMQATVIISSSQREALHAAKNQVGSLKILNGPKSGELIELSKPYNTVGKPGIQVAVVAKRVQGFFLVPVAMGSGQGAPKLNEHAVGASSVALKNGDILEVAGVRLEFIQKT